MNFFLDLLWKVIIYSVLYMTKSKYWMNSSFVAKIILNYKKKLHQLSSKQTRDTNFKPLFKSAS